jgi:thiol-disulfide isomerase/thioredoxin
MKVKFEKLIDEEKQNLLTVQQDYIKKYPDTFVAKLLTWKQSPYKNDKSRYWDDIDFTDESMIHSSIINDRIEEYMQTHSKGTETGFLNGIDLIAGKAEVNERVRSFCILTLLEGFYTSKKEDICAYIMDNYIYGENCGSGDYADLLKSRASGVRNLQVGSTPPDFTVSKWDKGSINLNSEVSKYDYTLLMFWSSWCHKCEQEMPVLQTLYDKYHSKGFQVVGYSVDGDRNSWVDAITERNIPWPNVAELQIWEGSVPKGYRVSDTPQLFLLDRNRELVLKPERIFHVEDFLKKNLN